MKTNKIKEIENRLVLDIENILFEAKHNTFDKGAILNSISTLLQDAEVDSEIIVNVLEQFGEEGKEVALAVKVKEGW